VKVATRLADFLRGLSAVAFQVSELASVAAEIISPDDLKVSDAEGQPADEDSATGDPFAFVGITPEGVDMLVKPEKERPSRPQPEPFIGSIDERMQRGRSGVS
jgi:hypothetical protein